MKKIFGISMMVIGILFSLSMVINLSASIEKIEGFYASGQSGYASGLIIGKVIWFLLIVALVFFGDKLRKAK